MMQEEAEPRRTRGHDESTTGKRSDKTSGIAGQSLQRTREETGCRRSKRIGDQISSARCQEMRDAGHTWGEHGKTGGTFGKIER